MNELVEGGLWEPERIRWDHPKLEKYIEDNWKDKGDKELAEDLSEMTGKNVTPAKVKDKRLDMGLNRHDNPKEWDHSNVGPDTLIDWKSLEVVKYIQTRYRDKSDLELARGLSEKFDEDITWKMVRRHRLRMGYHREQGTNEHKLTLSTPERRRFIFENHPRLNGDYETIDKFLVAFYDKFDVKVGIRTLKKRMREFLRSDPGIKNLKQVRLSQELWDKIGRWLRD